MNIILWIIVIALFIISFVGLLYPVIPSVVLIWIGVLVAHFFISPIALSWWTWITFIIITTLLFVADYLATLYFVQRYGGSKWGIRMATIGVIIGCFVVPPFGILIIPFILVFITELILRAPLLIALKIAVGTFIAFISSTFAKALLQLLMIIVFLLDAFF